MSEQTEKKRNMEMSDMIDLTSISILRKAEQRIATLEAENAELEKKVLELEPRAFFGDQCYQDRCENAYVEQSVVKDIETHLHSLQVAGNAMAATLKRDGECSCFGDLTCEGCAELAKWDAAKGETS